MDAVAVFSSGSATTKSVYDGAGRLSVQYTTDGGAVNNGNVPLKDWADASVVTGDIVLSQKEYTYDSDGNVTLTVTRDRFDNDATTATGNLGSPTSGVGARVYYLADYYDAADRLITEVNAGTNGGVSWTPPASSADASIQRDHPVLRTDYAYNVAGEMYQLTDPRSLETQYSFDLLGRKTQEIDNAAGSPSTGSTITNFTYDGDDHILTMVAFQPDGSGSNSQTTQYKYGVGQTQGTDLFSNDLIAKVIYPDPATGNAIDTPADDVSYTYDLLGES